MSFGGKFNYAKEYAKYKPNQPDSIFEQYVDDTPDLLAAWNQIQDDPSGTQGSYWKPRGATSKAAFGRAHAAEDFALSEGTYQGGTDVDPYSDPTRFESFMDTLSTTPATGEEEPARPGFNPYLGDNPSFPLLDTAYSAPSAPSWAQGGGGLIPDAYAPWASSSMQTGEGGYVPQNIWEGEGPVQGLGYGVTHTAPATGLINIPAEESSTSGMNTTTDTSGKQWVMSPGGQWYPADSDYATDLENDNVTTSGHYDSSGNYIGAEGSHYDSDGNEVTAQCYYTGGHVTDLGLISLPGSVQSGTNKGAKVKGGYTPAGERSMPAGQTRATPGTKAP